MARWIRYEHQGRIGFGTIDGETISVHAGDMFADAAPTGATLALAEVRALTPSVPTKMVALWNNFKALGAKLNVAAPDEPLYLLKAPNSFLAPGGTIRRPASYDGKIVYEGELGIVIGKQCTNADEAAAEAAIFGYTCINDVTAADIITKNADFAQWVRAKSYDTFGAFGPVIATDLDPMTVSVRTVLNGAERQNYPISDAYFPPCRLVSLISHDMTLEPGDVIACGTSVGVGAMKEKSNVVEVTIDGIGTLTNAFEQ